MEKKICIITGSRADSGLLAPVIRELKDQCDLTLLVTGSHLSNEYGNTWTELDQEVNQIHIPILQDYDQPVATNTSMALGIHNFSNTLANLQPDKMVVLGDRYEVFAAAIAAYNLRIPIVHIQGGDVTTGSLDDGYRDCISRLSSTHLAGSHSACGRLEVLYDNVYNVGSLACVLPEVEANSTYDYVVVVHPSDEDVLNMVVKALEDKIGRVLMIGSNADAGGRDINDQMRLIAELVPNWYFVESLPREEYLSYLKGAKALVGNSSSGIFEAPMLGTKTINIGTRQNGRTLPDDEFSTPYYKPDTVNQIVKHII